jgi:hypothetical protein
VLAIDQYATVRLVNGCAVGSDRLIDTDLGEAHPLNPVGQSLCSQLLRGATPEGLAAHLIELGAPKGEARSDVHAFLEVLNSRSLLEVSKPPFSRRARSLCGMLRAPTRLFIAAWLRIAGDEVAPSKRWLPSVRGLAQAVAWTTAPVAMIGGALTAIIVAADLASSRGQASALDVGSLVYSGVFIYFCHVLLTFTHEFAHLRALRAFGGRVRYVRTSGLRVAVVHDALGGFADRISAIAGPLAAALVGGSLTVLLALLSELRSEYIPQVMWAFPLGLGTIHLLGLLPWSADGRALFRRIPRRARS